MPVSKCTHMEYGLKENHIAAVPYTNETSHRQNSKCCLTFHKLLKMRVSYS